ncbi:MAG: prepilin-type N-terminal cleavage/methylation domain-containing protein [Candidatus Omnitrophica bacterium]|nr:prepilin-type N-terminal cleavage/methylation domain-containing protein [Candidatus Omnitrophota bacterium]MBU1869228.1 prepilin-type N-terminal cleavage/methylation domain-containing protein [Candidatus Omnitrophota bacterium]
MRNKSVTLIELVIVVLIVGILAGSWAVVSHNPNKLIGAATKVAFDLRYAQQLAISRQTTCGVSYDIAGNSYFVYQGTIATKAEDPSTGNDFIVNFNTDAVYKGVSLTSTNFGDRIYFDYLGRPYNNGDSLLTSAGTVVISLGSGSKTITITPNTGEVKGHE